MIRRPAPSLRIGLPKVRRLTAAATTLAWRSPPAAGVSRRIDLRGLPKVRRLTAAATVLPWRSPVAAGVSRRMIQRGLPKVRRLTAAARRLELSHGFERSVDPESLRGLRGSGALRFPLAAVTVDADRAPRGRLDPTQRHVQGQDDLPLAC